jgi:hypothetical protein
VKKPVFEEMVSSTPVETVSRPEVKSSSVAEGAAVKKPVFEELIAVARRVDNEPIGRENSSIKEGLRGGGEVPVMEVDREASDVELKPGSSDFEIPTKEEVSVPVAIKDSVSGSTMSPTSITSKKIALDAPEVNDVKNPLPTPEPTQSVKKGNNDGGVNVVPKGGEEELDEELSDSFANQNSGLLMAGGGAFIILGLYVCFKKFGSDQPTKAVGYAPVSSAEHDYAGRGNGVGNLDLEAGGGGIELTVADDGNDSWDDESDSEFNSSSRTSSMSPTFKPAISLTAPPRPHSVSPVIPPVLGTSKSGGSIGSLSSAGSFSSAPIASSNSNSSSSPSVTKSMKTKAKSKSKYPPLNSTTDDIFAVRRYSRTL